MMACPIQAAMIERHLIMPLDGCQTKVGGSSGALCLVGSARHMGRHADLCEGRAKDGSRVVVDVNLEALDGLAGVETLGANARAVHDGVALVHLQLVLGQELDTLLTNRVTTVVDPAESL